MFAEGNYPLLLRKNNKQIPIGVVGVIFLPDRRLHLTVRITAAEHQTVARKCIAKRKFLQNFWSETPYFEVSEKGYCYAQKQQ